jgi:hypothetical protein
VAHVNFHIAEGLGLGAALGAVPLARAWLAGRPLAMPILRVALLSFALAGWAIVPQVLTTLGSYPSVHTAPWANLFLGHAVIDRRVDGGLLVGELIIAAWLVGLYALILLAIVRARRQTVRLRSGTG